MQSEERRKNWTLIETPACKLIKEITPVNGREISRNSQSTENTGIAVRLSVSRILVRDLRRHLSWEYRSQVEVSAVTFLALNINRTKKSQELPARTSPKKKEPLVPCQKIVRQMEIPRGLSRSSAAMIHLHSIRQRTKCKNKKL